MCEGCSPKTADQIKEEKEQKSLEWARQYAWDWFEYHAGQRTTMFNYGIATVAILAAGYGSAIEKQPLVACIIGAIGALISLSFVLVDGRNKFLVDRGEDVLRAIEQSSFPQNAALGSGSVMPAGILTVITTKDNASKAGAFLRGKHRFHMRAVQFVFLVAFAVGSFCAYKQYGQTEKTDEMAAATKMLAFSVCTMAKNIDKSGNHAIKDCEALIEPKNP